MRTERPPDTERNVGLSARAAGVGEGCFNVNSSKPNLYTVWTLDYGIRMGKRRKGSLNV